jgi:ArsR family transcriptional regulator, arsenate/arsenite/antimonite-responsive transcriptional repressor
MDAFRALADPTRREILRLLRDGPKTSGEIAEQFPTAWATISRHLGALRDAGLILSERNGQQILYELNTTVFQDLVEHLLDWVRPTKSDRARRPRSGGGKHA